MAGASQETYGRSSTQLELPARLAKNTGAHPLLKLLCFSYVSTTNFVKTSPELAPLFARVAHLAAIWSTSASSSFSRTCPRTYAKKRCERKMIRKPRLASKRSTDQQNQKVPTRTQASTAVATRMSPKTPNGNPRVKQVKSFYSKAFAIPFLRLGFPRIEAELRSALGARFTRVDPASISPLRQFGRLKTQRCCS